MNHLVLELSARNFGYLIAYIIPGFLALWGLSIVSEPIRLWLLGAGKSGPSIGGVIYLLLACVAAGMTDNTLLHRQVNPSWVQQGRVTSQAFRPTPKDEKKLSAYDGDKITAGLAWEHFTTTLTLSSVGVLAVTVAECKSLDLAAEPDEKEFFEHALIDFTPYPEKQIVTKSKRLKAHAETRGWQYPKIIA